MTEPEVPPTQFDPGVCSREGCNKVLLNTVWWEPEEGVFTCDEHFYHADGAWEQSDVPGFWRRKEVTRLTIDDRYEIFRSTILQAWAEGQSPMGELKSRAIDLALVEAEKRESWLVTAYAEGFLQGLKDAGGIYLDTSNKATGLVEYALEMPQEDYLSKGVPRETGFMPNGTLGGEWKFATLTKPTE